jgi:hypothetical protein
VYLKLYLRLKFLGFHKHFLYKLYVLVMFSCIICINIVAHLIFFDLYGLFYFCLDVLYGVLVDLLVLDPRFRNKREKIYRNVIFSIKYMVH